MKYPRREYQLQFVTSFLSFDSEGSQASIYLLPPTTAGELDTVGIAHSCFVNCDFFGHVDNGVEHRQGPVVQGVKIPCTQPEVLESGERTEVHKRPIHRKLFQ